MESPYPLIRIPAEVVITCLAAPISLFSLPGSHTFSGCRPDFRADRFNNVVINFTKRPCRFGNDINPFGERSGYQRAGF